MLRFHSILYLFLLLSFFSVLALAGTQDGSLGPTSTGQADIAFQIASIASISGLRDVSIDHIDPVNDTLPPSVILPGICLYSSTGSVSVTAKTTAPYNQEIDFKNKLGKLESESGTQLDFQLQLNQQDLFADTEPLFSSNFNSLTCEDGVGVYPLRVALTKVPHQVGNYRATVNILVTPK